MDVDPAGSLIARANAILPVIIIGETTSWPADDGWTQLAQGFDNIGAEAAYIGYG